jgi:signal transduction histidine kinase
MIWVLVATIALCWAGALAMLFAYFTHNKTSTWDEKLQTIAIRILMTIPANNKLQTILGPGLKLRNPALAEHDKLVFQVWFDRSKLVARTPGAPEVALRPDFIEGVASTVIEGQRWRVYSVSDSTGHVDVQVGNLHSVVDAEMRHDALIGLVLATLLLLLVGGVMWFVVRNTLKPVVALGTAMRNRRSFDLAPLPSVPLPRELHPLVESFNHALKQLDEAVEGERRFIGNAAHELRTPLSALQAQAQIALRAPSVEEKDVALTKLLTVAQRSTRLSEQLLDLARLNSGANAPLHSPADLSSLVLHVVHEFEIYACQQQRSIFLDIHQCMIHCDIDEIGILLRNLVDNALRYTAKGGRVCISCGYQGTATLEQNNNVYLEVTDDGPGVPESEREAIFERFHRVAGTLTRGSGIGLSLVASIAQLHCATIETHAGLDGRGLAVRVVFPGATSVDGSIN